MYLFYFSFIFLFAFYVFFLIFKFNEIYLIVSLDIYSFDIFYVHVLSSIFNLILFWICLFITVFLLISFLPFSFVLFRHCFVISSIFYCLFSIITGEFWSISTWGTWAPFDSRFLSQFLFLFLNLCVYIFVDYSLYYSFRNFLVLSHFLFLFLALNFPLVKYSVS